MYNERNFLIYSHKIILHRLKFIKINQSINEGSYTGSDFLFNVTIISIELALYWVSTNFEMIKSLEGNAHRLYANSTLKRLEHLSLSLYIYIYIYIYIYPGSLEKSLNSIRLAQGLPTLKMTVKFFNGCFIEFPFHSLRESIFNYFCREFRSEIVASLIGKKGALFYYKIKNKHSN